jgi:transcriptional regulator with XRE-family HTH domain
VDIDKAVKKLAGLVYDARTSMNLRQKDFGKLFGASNASISNIENGNYLDLPEHRTLNRLATEILKIEYSELIAILEADQEVSTPESVTNEQLVAQAMAIFEKLDLDSLYDVHFALAKRIDRVRSQK